MRWTRARNGRSATGGETVGEPAPEEGSALDLLSEEEDDEEAVLSGVDPGSPAPPDVEPPALTVARRGWELLDPAPRLAFTPRPYQEEALAAWIANAGRGVVVLPTGAGKTLVALLAVRAMGCDACVVAPTRALVGQWFAQLADAFGAERVGAYYGDEKDVRALTVTTYHSAFALVERWGARFGLLVLDEAHHLADTSTGEARAWHDHLRIAPSPCRLGLTATYPDGQDGWSIVGWPSGSRWRRSPRRRVWIG